MTRRNREDELTNTFPTVVLTDYGPLAPSLGWATIPVLVIWTVATVLWWLIGRRRDRDPTGLVAGCIVQFTLFLLLDVNVGMTVTFGDVAILVDPKIMCLCVSQILFGALVAGTVALACASCACIAAKRLPRIPLHTVSPLIIALFDLALSLQWMMWVCTQRD